MKRLLFAASFFLSFTCMAQLTSLVVRNDTIFNFDPSTATYTQLTKLIPPMAGQSGKVISNNGSAYTWITPFDGAYGSLTGTPDLSAYSLTSHTHTFASLTSKPTTLSGYGITDAAPLASPTFTGTVTLPASTSFTTPVIGVATGTSLAATGAITSSGGGMGYATGAGGAVSQSGNKSTGVTLNKLTGTITMVNSALAAAAEAKFTVTNSTVAATDVVIVNIKSGGTSGSYLIAVTAVGAGSFDITISNVSAGSLSEAVVISFAVIKAVNN
jgi:hypothetical protein